MTRTRSVVCCLAVLTAVGAAGCGSSGSANADPQSLVTQAKTALDQTSGLHFTLTSANTPKSGTRLVGGNGDVARPAGFQGTLQVTQSGVLLSVNVISVSGTVYIQPPLQSKYAVTDPHKYGFSDPGKLLDPTTGLSSLLTDLTSTTAAGRDRFNGEKLTEIAVTLPGTAVAQVLTSADKAKPVTGKLGIDPSSHQLRRAVLVGPFLDKSVMTTFTIVLDHYGEHPTISAPS